MKYEKRIFKIRTPENFNKNLIQRERDRQGIN